MGHSLQCLTRLIVLSFSFDAPLTKPAILYTGEEEITVTRLFATLISEQSATVKYGSFYSLDQ